jgi:hypothetical protein
MVPMTFYGITVHEMTTAEAVGFFAVVGAVLVAVAIVVICAVRSARRKRP